MTQVRGSSGQLLIAYETTYGADPTPTAAIGPMPFNTYDVAAERALNKSNTIVNDINPTEPWSGNTDVRGALVVPVDAVCFGFHLKSMFGTQVSEVGGDYTDEAVVAEADDDTITLASHGMSDGQCITVGGTAVPGGLAAGTRYFLRDSDTNTFKLALRPGGTAIDLTDDGTSVTITTVNAHVFRVSGSMPSLVHELGLTASSAEYHKFNGCKTASLALDLSADNNEFTAEMQIIGSSPADPTDSAYDSNPTSPGSIVRFNKFHGTVQEGGSSFAIAKKCTLDVNFDLDEDTFVVGGAGKRGDMAQGIAGISGSLEVLYTGHAALLDKAVNETESSLLYTFTNGTYILEFRIPQVKYSLTGPKVSGPKGILLPLKFEAFKNSSNTWGTALQVTLVNARDEAY